MSDQTIVKERFTSSALIINLSKLFSSIYCAASAVPIEQLNRLNEDTRLRKRKFEICG